MDGVAILAGLQQELEATQQRCQMIERTMDGIRELYGLAGDVELEDEPAPRARSKAKAVKSSRGDGDETYGAAILTLLKQRGGVMKPGELCKALKTTPGSLRRWLAPLEKAKQVVVSGVTAGRRVSLPGHKPAKEAP